MKISLVLTMTCLLASHVVMGELLNALHLLHSSDGFQYLTPDEQVMLVELIAVADACKLHAYEQQIDRDAVKAMLAHLPNAEEHQLDVYLHNHIRKETTGQCVPNQDIKTTTALPSF